MALNVLLSATTAIAQKTKATKQPNIVFIISDDQRWDALGAAGNTKIKTPVLDKLAREGVYFRQATIHISQCAPSRASLLTGLSPHQHGYYSNNFVRTNMQWQDSFPLPTLPGLLKDAGYRTVLIGKWHLATQPWLTGFSEVRTWLPLGAISYTDPLLAKGNSRKTEVVEGFTNGIFANDAVEFLGSDAAKEKPFFLWLAATIPHGPFQPNPSHIQQLYAGKTSNDLLPPGFSNDTAGKFSFVNYYEAVSYLDELVGKVISTLEKQGLDKNTIVVFLGDNGFMAGSRGIRGKVVPWEESVRVPLIIRTPKKFSNIKGTNDLPVSSLDLSPTILAMAGVTVPKTFVGRNLLPVLKGSRNHGIDYAVNVWVDTIGQFRYYTQRSIRTPKYKLIHWHKPGMPDELYDLIADPYEKTNINDNATIKSVRDKLQNQLNDWMQRTNDPALFWQTKTATKLNYEEEIRAESERAGDFEIKTPVKVDPKIYDAYIGRYEMVTRFIITISREGDKLFYQGDGNKSELFPESETEFYMNPTQPGRFTFLKNDEGQVTHLVRRNRIEADELITDKEARKIE